MHPDGVNGIFFYRIVFGDSALYVEFIAPIIIQFAQLALSFFLVIATSRVYALFIELGGTALLPENRLSTGKVCFVVLKT